MVSPEVARAKEICLRLLTTRMRSRGELADALAKREIAPDDAEAALDRLTDVGLIDDAAFAAAFVRAQHRGRGLSRAALHRELRRKGVAAEVAADAVADIDESDEYDRAERLVAKKLDSAVMAGLTGARRRLLGMLARRGYPASVAVPVVNQALDGYADPLDVPADEPLDMD